VRQCDNVALSGLIRPSKPTDFDPKTVISGRKEAFSGQRCRISGSCSVVLAVGKLPNVAPAHGLKAMRFNELGVESESGGENHRNVAPDAGFVDN
jgi:hypothetical protein